MTVPGGQEQKRCSVRAWSGDHCTSEDGHDGDHTFGWEIPPKRAGGQEQDVETNYFSVPMTDEEALAYWPAEYNKLADRYQAAVAEAESLRQALWCHHDEDTIRYVARDHETWNYCTECGLMELWAGGALIKQEVVPPDLAALAAADATQEPTCP